MTPRERAVETAHAAVGGAVAGLTGGFFMMVFLVLDAAGLGMGYPEPLLEIAASFIGPRALVGGPSTVVLGLFLHFVVAAVWGALFGVLLPRDIGGGPALSYALGAAFVVLLGMTFVALPLFDPTMRARVPLYWGSWFFGHVLYGIGLALTPLLRRTFWPAPASAVTA